MRRVWQGNSNFTQYRRRTFLRSYYESNGNCKWNDKFYFDENVRRRRAYNDVLKEAQQLGFAEADPTSDVEGLDAARKMTILATLGFSTNVELGDVKVKGITSITEEDIEYSKSLGYTIKLIGLAKRDGEKLEVTVEPTLLPNTHPLAAVQNEYNAVYVYGEAVGETMFYGPGAGSLPTATAVVSDLVAVMQNIRLGVTGNSAVVPQYQKVLKEPDEIVVKKF